MENEQGKQQKSKWQNRVSTVELLERAAPMLKRQERHNEGTLTALITTNHSHYKMDAK